MPHPLHNSLARILTADGSPVGAGFLAAENLIITCAHVITAAGSGDETVRFDLPLLAPGESFSGRVLYRDDGQDVACLEVANLPEQAIPAPLIKSDTLWGHTFRAFGFPAGYENGVWASGRILGREATGWLQIEDTKETGYFVQPGFSGGPIWDERLGGVVALVIATDTHAGVRTAFALPVTKALGKWRERGQIQIDLLEKNLDSPPLDTYFPTQIQASGNAPSLEKTSRKKRIFLSYKRGVEPDETLVLAIYDALSKEHDVFIDSLMPVGTVWQERIQEELERCDFLIPLLSAASVQSEMVEYEISNAYQLGRSHNGKPQILPVRVAYTAPFEYPLSAYLNPLNWAFWRNEADTPALIAELNAALTGGSLRLSDLRKKEAVLRQPQPETIPRPRASADIAQIERPDGTMDVESRFYIERPGDAIARRELARGGATIVIKAPRQMGKSSLLVRAAAQARSLGREVAFLDFQLLDTATLNDPQYFFQNFCRWIADELDLDAPVEPVWAGGLGHVQSATKYIRRHVLHKLESPVTLVIDEADRMLDCPFRSDFFGMLRSWHNHRATRQEWRKLDLAIVISTEPYLLIEDLKQSPFNVGEVIRLEDFTLAQSADLNDRHGSPYSPPQIERLYQLLSGHPYLTRQALYRVAVGELDPESLLANATADQGPFGDHLRRHLTRFSESPVLARAMRQIIRHQRCEDEILYHRLIGAGLALRRGERVLPRCELYARYFGERLSHA